MSGDGQFLQDYVQLMTRHQGDLRAFIISLMPGLPGVSDVLQETNLVLWQKRDNFRPGSNFMAWACTIARYEVMHQLHRARRDRRLVFSDELIETLVREPDATAAGSEHLAALGECLGQLEERERELVHYRYSEGRTLEELSRLRDKSAGALRTALFRIRAALKKCVQDKLQEGGLG